MAGGYFAGNYFQLLPQKGIRLKDGTLIITGTGSPEGVETAPIGSWYTNTSNGDWYRKLSGAGNTGWVANTFNLLQDGSLASPSLAFASNTGSGMFYTDTLTGFLYLVTDGGERVRIGPNETSFTTQGGTRIGEFNENGYMGLDNYLLITDEKSANTAGGTATSGSWQTRTLNTVKVDRISGASLSSNQITLPAGAYKVEAIAPAFAVNRHKAKLRNVTDSSDLIIGSSAYAIAANLAQTDSVINGEFTLSGTKAIELQHRVQDTRSTDGFGLESNLGVVEVYSQIKIWKII